MKLRLIIIFALCLVHSASQAQDVKELFEGKVAVNLLLNDLSDLRKDLNKHHPGLYWFVDKGTLNKKFDSLKNTIRVPLSRMEFRYKVLTVLQCIGDGHMSLVMNANHIQPADYESYVWNRILPVQQLDFKAIGSRLYVMGSSYHTQLPPGAEILAMNGIPAADVIAKLINGLPGDGRNSTLKYFVLNGAFSNSYSDMIGRQDSIDFKIKDTQGERSVMLRTITGQAAAKPIVAIPNMLSKQIVDEGFATLKIDNFTTFIPQNYNFFFGNLKFRDIRTLVLDLRNNTGGEQSAVTALFAYLITEPSYFAVVPDAILKNPEKTPLESMKIGITSKVVPNKNAFNGKLYVLINGGSFSATAILAANLQAINNNIVIVGEESGGARAGCTAGSFRIVALKNSNLSLRYGQIPIKSIVSTETGGRGVIPNVPIKYSIEDYVAKRDLEMEWVRKKLVLSKY